jgi:F-type H+-transporting ATPase subunit gamma
MLSKAAFRLNSNYLMLTGARRGFAVSEKQIKQRSKSVNSIAKITKAMKMVSASKMRGEL